jgi:hypothetical protein
MMHTDLPPLVKTGRPVSEPHLALLQAAHALRIEYAQSGRGATLLEMVRRSQVGYQVARVLVPKLKKRGQLQEVGERRVHYRNRPVKEYAPAAPNSSSAKDGRIELCDVLQCWIR